MLFNSLTRRAALGASVAMLLASSALADDIRLRIAGTHAPDHTNTILLGQIKEELESAGVGITVQLFPANQLGSGEQVFGDVRKGAIDIGNTFIYPTNDPRLEISSVPYLAESYEQMRRIFSPGSNYYTAFSGLLAEQDIKLLGLLGEGFVGVGASKLPDNATTVGDKGMTIRVWSANVAQRTAADLGFNTTTIDWGDVFPALQQGIVDGVIGGTPEANYTMWRDALNYYIPYDSFVETTGYYISDGVWDKMNAEQQAVVEAAFSSAALSSFDQSEAKDAEFLTKLEEAGVEIVHLSDEERGAIAAHVRSSTWPVLEETFGSELMDALKRDIE